MHNIKKYATIISVVIVSAVTIYTDFTQDIAIQADSMDRFSDIEQPISSTSSIILRKKAPTTLAESITPNDDHIVPLPRINMPKSLDNTDPSSLVHVDNDNQLVLNHDIKVLFDYFFSSEGDLSNAELLTSMQQYIEQTYPQPAAQQVIALLNKYVDYKQQMQDFHAQSTALQDLPDLNTLTDSDTLQTVETLMQDRQDMREHIFSQAENEAMFSKEINYDNYMLNLAKLSNDLSPAERKQQIALIAQQHLTEQQRKDRQQTFILQRTPPNFSIDSHGECQGNAQDFNTQQIAALCDLAKKRLARSKSTS